MTAWNSRDTLAGVINALKLVGKKLDEVKIVTSGAGAAGIAIIRLLISMGLKNVIMTTAKVRFTRDATASTRSKRRWRRSQTTTMRRARLQR